MKYDVTIVGAGPGGSTTAKHLSEKGFKVLLVDKSKFPRVKHCGGGLPIKVLDRFKYLRDSGLIESYAYGGFIHPASLTFKIEVKKEKPLLAMVIRKKFDNGLVQLAKDQGVEFKDKKKAVDIKIEKEATIVKFEDGAKIESEIVVGADGVWSTIGTKTGLIENNRSVSISLYSEIPLSQKTMDQYFTEKRYGHMHLKVLGIAGYGWVFPKKEHVNIGIGEFNLGEKTKDKINLKEYFKKYLQILKESLIIPKDLKVNQIYGAALPSHHVKQSYSDRVVLIGDAAGLVNPFTGEGIDYAMYSGRIAANTIINSLECRDTSSNFLSKYERDWKNDFGKDLRFFYKSARMWRRENEKFIKHVSKDKKLSEMVLDIASGNIGVHDCRGKLIKRYLYCVLRDAFKK
jgi:geranylgeranyl reductase family protein